MSVNNVAWYAVGKLFDKQHAFTLTPSSTMVFFVFGVYVFCLNATSQKKKIIKEETFNALKFIAVAFKHNIHIIYTQLFWIALTSRIHFGLLCRLFGVCVCVYIWRANEMSYCFANPASTFFPNAFHHKSFAFVTCFFSLPFFNKIYACVK